VAVELEVPVRVGREPVVVAAVQHDLVVIADALAGQQGLELLLVDEVPADLVLQLGLPVDAHGAGDVPAVVGGGVLVDLDEHDAGRLDVLLGPVGRDQGGFATHGCSLSQDGGGFESPHGHEAARDPRGRITVSAMSLLIARGERSSPARPIGLGRRCLEPLRKHAAGPHH